MRFVILIVVITIWLWTRAALEKNLGGEHAPFAPPSSAALGLGDNALWWYWMFYYNGLGDNASWWYWLFSSQGWLRVIMVLIFVNNMVREITLHVAVRWVIPRPVPCTFTADYSQNVKKLIFFSNIVVFYIKRSAWNHWWTSKSPFSKILKNVEVIAKKH